MAIFFLSQLWAEKTGDFRLFFLIHPLFTPWQNQALERRPTAYSPVTLAVDLVLKSVICKKVRAELGNWLNLKPNERAYSYF